MAHNAWEITNPKALCVAGMHYEKYSVLLNSIAGIVFLGTPHRLEGTSPQQFGARLIAILRLEVGNLLSRQSLQQLRNNSGLISDLAIRFNKTNLRVDMLSVYERKVTKIRSYGIKRTKKIIVSICSLY